MGEKKRKDPRYQRYYKEPPSRLRRPVLGPQLATMTEWVPSLTDANASPAVQAHGQRLATLVQRAENAVKALSSAEAAVTDFETIGAKKAFVDQLNALRMTAFGQIAELPHSRPELNLPADFAQRFFLRDAADKKPSISSVEQAILRARARVAELEAQLARLVEEADAEARLAEEAEVREAMKVLEKAEKERAAAEQKIEAARARLTAKKKGEE